MGQFWMNTATTDIDLPNLGHAYNGSDRLICSFRKVSPDLLDN